MSRTTPVITLNRILKYDPCVEGLARLEERLAGKNNGKPWSRRKDFDVTEILPESPGAHWHEVSDFLWAMAVVRSSRNTLQRDLIDIMTLCAGSFCSKVIPASCVAQFTEAAKDVMMPSKMAVSYATFLAHRDNSLRCILNNTPRSNIASAMYKSIYRAMVSIIVDIVTLTIGSRRMRADNHIGTDTAYRILEFLWECQLTPARFCTLVRNYYKDR